MTAIFKHHFELLTACIIYGNVGIFMEGLREMSVGSIIFYRVFFGLLAIICYLAITGNLNQLSLKRKKTYLLLLGILYVAQMFSYYSAIRHLGASSAVLLLYTDPIYLTFLAPILLGEKNTQKTILALFLGLLGVFYVMRPEEGFEHLTYGSNYLKGVFFGLIGGFFSSGVIISVRYLKDEYDGLTQLFWQSTISLVFLSPFAISMPGHIVASNLPVLMLFGTLITGVGAVLYIRGVAGVSAVTGSILTLLEPVSCIFFDYTVLGNPIHKGMLIGCIFILAAALLISLDNILLIKKMILGEKAIFEDRYFSGIRNFVEDRMSIFLSSCISKLKI